MERSDKLLWGLDFLITAVGWYLVGRAAALLAGVASGLDL